jgi:hypothetical protein
VPLLLFVVLIVSALTPLVMCLQVRVRTVGPGPGYWGREGADPRARPRGQGVRGGGLRHHRLIRHHPVRLVAAYASRLFAALLSFLVFSLRCNSLKGLSHEIDYKNFDKNLQNLT